MVANRRYPPSVQSGIPRLGAKPKGWTTSAFGQVLQAVERPVTLLPDVEYELVLAKRNRGGVVSRGRRIGRSIKTRQQFVVQSGDFLISRRQIVHGGCGLVPVTLNGAITSGEYSALVPQRDRLLPEYIALLSHARYVQQTFFHASVGVDVEKMIFDLDRWLDYSIHLPSIAEQDAIITAVALLDSVEQGTARLLALKERFRVQLMREILDSHDGAEDTHTRHQLREVAQINPQTLPQTTDPTFRFRYIDLGSVSEQEVDLTKVRELQFASAPSRARRVCQPGDVLMSTVRPHLMGHARVPDTIHQPLVCSTGFAVIRPHDPMASSLIYHQLFSEHIKQQTLARVSGSSYPALGDDDVGSLIVSLPSATDALRSISSALDGLGAEISILRRSVEVRRLLRKAVLSRLLTGELRLRLT